MRARVFRCCLGCLLAFLCAARGAQLRLADRWFYLPTNLRVDKNIDDAEALIKRAAQAGYTGVLLHDAKFAKLDSLEPHYFTNVARIKAVAAALHLEIVPTLFELGYSNDLLWHDPNLVEALPVKGAPFVVRQGEARLEPPPGELLKGGDFSDLSQWAWHDPDVMADAGAARVRERSSPNARIAERIRLEPFRQYHLSVRIKTEDFTAQPEIKVLAGQQELNYQSLGVQRTQDWMVHHVVFNSLDHREATLYLGVWGKSRGSLWWDDAKLEQVAFVNLVRRDGAPLEVVAEGGPTLTEGKDFARLTDPLMGTRPYNGCYDVYHDPPPLRTSLPEGTRLRVSYYFAATVGDGQAMICPSEKRTSELLLDEARRVHAAWGARGYMMSHDEIRVLNWCAACTRRNLDAGEILADNVRTCLRILRQVNPGGKIYVWSDMFDPFHNAHDHYYLVRGNLAGSWEGLDKDVVVVNWNAGKRDESLNWFAGRGGAQMIAGYYDGAPEDIRGWLAAAKKVSGVTGVIYTTWQHKYEDLERFADLVEQGR